MKRYPRALVAGVAAMALAFPALTHRAKAGGAPRVGEQQPAAKETILPAAFSPGGKFLARAAKDGTIEVWQPEGGGRKLSLAGHPEGVHSLTFSPDGKTLASGGADGEVKLWDVATGRTKATLEGASIKPSLGFSPDGKLLAAAYPRTCVPAIVEVWDLAGGKRREISRSMRKSFGAVAFSPDGKTLATAGNDVQLWDVAAARLEATLEESELRFDSRPLAFSPDGKSLAVGNPRGCPWITVYDTATGKCLTLFDGPPNNIPVVAFSPDSKVLVWAFDQTVVVYQESTKKGVVYLKGHGRIASMTFDAAGRLHVSRLPTVEVLDVSKAAGK